MSDVKIRIRKWPDKAIGPLGEGRSYTVDEVDIRWDLMTNTWECCLPGVGKIPSFLIGRVVDGEVLITETTLDTQPAGGPLADRAKVALVELLEAGEDLGEWEFVYPSSSPHFRGGGPRKAYRQRKTRPMI